LRCSCNFNGEFIVGSGLVKLLFDVYVDFSALYAFVAQDFFDMPGAFGFMLLGCCFPMP
jgi:hypothetical protein